MKYTEDTPIHLTESEMHVLEGHLQEQWPDAMSYPINADEGYAFYGTSTSTSSEYQLEIGIDRIYEILGTKALNDRGEVSALSGIYYPGATPTRNTLSQATLYFDEVFIMSPGSTVFENRRHPYGESDQLLADRYEEQHLQFLKRLRSFDSDAITLKRAGVLKQTLPVMQDRPEFIDLITSDLADPKFCQIADNLNGISVFVAAKKMEPLLPLVGAGKDIDSIRAELDFRSTYADFRKKGIKELFNPRTYGVKEVDKILGASILLNHTLLLSEEYNLLPFTDDPIFERLLQCKLERISGTKGFVDYKKELGLVSSTLSLNVLEEYLPRFKFEDYDQIIEARVKLSGPLGDFRDAMRSYAAEIDTTSYSPELRQSLDKILHSKIKPAVKSIEQEVQKSRDSFVSKYLRNIRVGSVPVVASIFAGLPTTSVLAIGAGFMTIEAAIETRNDIKRSKNNGLRIFLQE